MNPTQTPGPVFQRGTNPIWAGFIAIYLVGALGLDFYWLFTETGAIAWLAELQASIFGGVWYPKLAFVLLLLAQLVPVILLKLALEAILGKKLAPGDPNR